MPLEVLFVILRLMSEIKILRNVSKRTGNISPCLLELIP
uniref:Uncharacterized protein n=1 Tax=Myoviridae sp. ctA4D8 TaxID=2823535 RepID=A0A8S5L6S7_9CAUD|nr:MAG TPA: hypothetical protein [Myoviridae sp. ctA4D8]